MIAVREREAADCSALYLLMAVPEHLMGIWMSEGIWGEVVDETASVPHPLLRSQLARL